MFSLVTTLELRVGCAKLVHSSVPTSQVTLSAVLCTEPFVEAGLSNSSGLRCWPSCPTASHQKHWVSDSSVRDLLSLSALNPGLSDFALLSKWDKNVLLACSADLLQAIWERPGFLGPELDFGLEREVGHMRVRLIQRNSHQLPPPGMWRTADPQKGLQSLCSAKVGTETRKWAHWKKHLEKKPTVGWGLCDLTWSFLSPPSVQMLLAAASYTCSLAATWGPPCFNTKWWAGHADSPFKSLVMYSKDIWARLRCPSFGFS